MNPVRVVLAGVHGHGGWHLANLRRLTESGLVRLVGVCDTRPATPGQLSGLGEPEQSDDLGALITHTGAEITILVTPIHTHTELATAALQAGSHLLLEKPPAGSLAGYERIASASKATGLACQVGFQSLASEAIPFLRKQIADGAIGRVRGIGVAGAWDRPAEYFTRAAWAGRRRLDGVAVTDGALTNPFAHAVATALAVAEAEALGAVRETDIELYHAHPIEADDTSCARIRLADGTLITVAVSLCAPRRTEPYLIVHGDAGHARLTYTLDEVRLRPAAGGAVSVSRHARTDLLENLIAHVRTGTQLLVPLTRVGAFMQVVEAVRLSREPVAIPGRQQRIRRDSLGAVTTRVLPGIADLTDKSANRLALFSELGVPWAPAVHTITIAGREVASYRWRPALPRTVSPRPYLHPVRTLRGVTVTETEPVDHPHHLGAGIAVSDVDGNNFWGGRTYLPERGPVWRADHGTQRHVSFARRERDGFVEHLEWLGPNGHPLLTEERAVRGVELAGAWALDFSSTLTNVTGAPLTVKSSATKGRAGAGYGGFFWRAPASATPRGVFTATEEDEAAINGSRAPWVALHCPQWTLIFVRRGGTDPWFVRSTEYPGIGLSLAWEQSLLLETSLTRRVITVVADGRLDRAGAADLASIATER